MYDKLNHTDFPPKETPLMVYDGNCGFCKYWIIKWKALTKESVNYAPYQRVMTHFKDVPVDYFKTAVRLILPNGDVISGPAAAYYSNQNNWIFSRLYKVYLKSPAFRKSSNRLYQWIADNRKLMYQISVRCFGKNPRKVRHYWLLYLVAIILAISGIANI